MADNHNICHILCAKGVVTKYRFFKKLPQISRTHKNCNPKQDN